MDPLEISELRALAEGASPPPWRLRKAGSGGLILVRDSRLKSTRNLQPMLQIYPEEDAIFISAARNNILELLNDAERAHALEKENEKLKKALAPFAEFVSGFDSSNNSSDIFYVSTRTVDGKIKSFTLKYGDFRRARRAYK